MDNNKIYNFPQSLLSNNECTIVKLDNLISATYRTVKNEKNTRINLTNDLLQLVLNGKKILLSENGKCEITPGQLCFVSKGSYITSQILPDESSPFHSLLFFFDTDFFTNYIAEHPDIFKNQSLKKTTPNTCIMDLPPFIKSNIDSISNYFLSPHKYKREVLELKLNELFYNLFELDNDNHLKNYLMNLAGSKKGNIRSYMEQNFTLPNTVEDFARQTFRSLSVFKKEFKDIYGVSCKSWVNNKRLERAHYLILHTDYNITEISFIAGFQSFSHFIKIFKEKYKITPKQLQKTKIDT